MQASATHSLPLSDCATAPKLLDRVRNRIRLKHYSLRTEQAYTDWIKRFILHHGKRHPNQMGADEVAAFLTHLAVAGKVAASTQNQAKSALLFLYREVLEIDLPWLDNVERAKAPKRLPVVLTRDEVHTILLHLIGTHRLIGSLLYGSGMRIMECLRLRVKDIEFSRREILIRDDKGFKDRVTMLPASSIEPLQAHLLRVRELHERDLADGVAPVFLPYALSRKYPEAGREWGWQYVFPAAGLSEDPRSDEVRRHHVLDQACQRAMKQAVRETGLVKPATPHTLRRSFTIPSPLICWNRAMTFVPFRNCWVTLMCRRRCCPLFCGYGVAGFIQKLRRKSLKEYAKRITWPSSPTEFPVVAVDAKFRLFSRLTAANQIRLFSVMHSSVNGLRQQPHTERRAYFAELHPVDGPTESVSIYPSGH